MSKFNIAERGHLVPLVFPKDITGGATGDRFTMKNWGHASIIFCIGAGATPTAVTVLACDAATAGNTAAIPFRVYKQETSLGDVLGAKVMATTSGFAPSANDNIFYVIEIDADELPEGKPWIELVIAAPASAILACAFAVLSDGRYEGPSSATAI